ncbi:unnamed protein product [Rotaria magnacalcarata]|uniref:HAT C-terminal dimerisation domain-containing protein n=3 Tax=Rotaria magnacalcarata TaxID=392030 RepID=A0A816EEQ7_9BILA|nr:unnamed protein product [Rotaria magnacalcarata]CAF1645759.1 unnamed protein product [Rotaria magnacalcarata]CAF3873854.1 unnamed protein product [Rotaria magnacalcarata]CAF3874774.1 unnamed protein product [Rotaria magnacalcarata]
MLRLLSSIFWLKLRKFLSLYPTFTIDKDVKRQLYWLAANGHIYEEFNNGICNESHAEDNLIHKPTTENHEREAEFRSDQFWTFLLVKSKPMCIEMYKIISYVYSIPCSNAFVKGVFSHMKSAWTASCNLMANEMIAAELKIRLNNTMTCEDFFSFAQPQPQLIKCAKSQQKYSFEKKRATLSVNINREDSL